MRCKFNQELGGNLLSKTFLAGGSNAWESSAWSAHPVTTLSNKLTQVIEIKSPKTKTLLFLVFICSVATWCDKLPLATLDSLQLQNFLFLLSVQPQLFATFFAGSVLTRWRHNDVRMFATFLFPLLLLLHCCAAVDLNYGGKKGVSGHLVVLRLPSLTLSFVQQKHSTAQLNHVI